MATNAHYFVLFSIYTANYSLTGTRICDMQNVIYIWLLRVEIWLDKSYSPFRRVSHRLSSPQTRLLLFMYSEKTNNGKC